MKKKQDHDDAAPVYQTERYLIVKIDDDAEKIKNVLATNEIRFKDLFIRSIVSDSWLLFHFRLFFFLSRGVNAKKHELHQASKEMLEPWRWCDDGKNN